MALTLSQIVKDEKNFKGKSIAEIDYSFQILDIFLSLTDGEWTISAELFNQGHGCVIQYSPSLALESLCGWDGRVGCSNWVPCCPSLKLDRTGLWQDKHLLEKWIKQCKLGRIRQLAIYTLEKFTKSRTDRQTDSTYVLSLLARD